MESAGDGRFTLLTLMIVALTAALVAGVGTWLLMNARLADAEERASLAEERIEALEAVLSGAEAAAAAAGDESPPSNDYYIVNKKPRLRSLPVDASLTVRMTSTTEGTRPEGYTWHSSSGSTPTRECPAPLGDSRRPLLDNHR